MTDVILFHDGCSICQSISATMMITFSGENFNFESINLATHKERGAQAKSLGITRLPSLVRIIRRLNITREGAARAGSSSTHNLKRSEGPI